MGDENDVIALRGASGIDGRERLSDVEDIARQGSEFNIVGVELGDARELLT